MVSEIRIGKVNEYIQQNKEVHISELEKEFADVSVMTLRRDLALLEQRGEIIRIRGGARSIKSLSQNYMREEAYSMRLLEHTAEKEILAKKAAGLVREGACIYLDAGTTCKTLAQQIPNMAISVLTNDPFVGIEMARRAQVSVTMVGGELSNENVSVSGVWALDFVKNINIETAFLSASGYSLESGFTIGGAGESELKRLIIKKAKRVVILIDSSKIGQSLMHTFATVADVDYIVTDGQLPPTFAKAAEAENVVIL